MEELNTLSEQARQHPWVTGAAVLYLLLCALGNKQLSQETAVKWPQFASLWVVAQKVGAIGRGILKPALGLVLPSVAKEVVEQVFPGAFSPDSTRPPTPPGAGS